MLARLLCALLLIAPYSLAQSGSSEQPATTQLKLAVILTRHGVRSPTSSMPGYSRHAWPDIEKDWRVECCGDLTPRGAELVFLMGAYYRSYFAEQKLLPRLGCVAPQTYIWADNEERTIATANALAEGLSGGLPGCVVAVNSLPYQTQPCSGDSKGCQRPPSAQTDLWFHPLPKLWPKVSPQENDELTAAANDINRRLPQLFSKYGPALQALQNVLACCTAPLCPTQPCTLRSLLPNTAASGAGKGGGALSWPGPFNVGSTASEIFLLEYGNGMPCRTVGWGNVRFDAPDCPGPGQSFRLMQEIHTAYFQEVQQKSIVGKIQGSNLGNQILQALQQEVQSPGKSPNRLIIFSGHDTNIANIAGLLNLKWKLPDLPDNDTPPAGALVFELWSSASGDNYVRVRYVHQTLTQLRTGVSLSAENPPNWVDVPVPGCKRSNCGFAEFQKIVSAAIDTNLVTKTPSGN